MNIDEALMAHTRWKRKLREDLSRPGNVLRPNDVSFDHKCELGDWIYGEGAGYSALPEYTKLKYEHARFHAAAAEIVRKANSGEVAIEDMQPCANSNFSTASSAVVIALMSMKKRQ